MNERLFNVLWLLLVVGVIALLALRVSSCRSPSHIESQAL
jgi:hypothetical protein